MDNDIVTQLTMFSLDDGTNALNKLLGEAADEIERLRADIGELRNLLWDAIKNDHQPPLLVNIPINPQYTAFIHPDANNG